MDANRVVLIGGSGFVGSAIASRLSARGKRVLIPTRRLERARPLSMLPNIEIVEASVHDPAVLARLFSGADAVINLVGILHDRDDRRPYGKGFAAAHVELPRTIVGAMRSAGVRRLLHMSALRASPAGPSAYLRSKAAGEAAVLESGLDVTVFRPSAIFGPGDRFLNTFAELLRQAPFLPLPGADARFQVVCVADVADSFAASLDDPASFGRIYELGGPRVYALRELVAAVGEMTGARRPIVGMPEALAWLQARVMSWLPDSPLSPDNLYSMREANVADPALAPPGWQPQALEAIAPLYLSAVKPERRFASFRCRARR